MKKSDMSSTSAADEWVRTGKVRPAKPTTKRLTIDVPADLHTRIKLQCTAGGAKMINVLRGVLEREFQAAMADIEPAPARAGRRQIAGWFAPEVARQLHQIALDNDTTLQALMAEAFNDLFAKHGKPPIAR